jgi:hypothetical protein
VPNKFSNLEKETSTMTFNIYKVKITEEMKNTSHLFSYYNRAFQTPKLVFCAVTGGLVSIVGGAITQMLFNSSCIKKPELTNKGCETGSTMIEYGVKRGYGHGFRANISHTDIIGLVSDAPLTATMDDESKQEARDQDVVYLVESELHHQRLMIDGMQYKNTDYPYAGYGVYFKDVRDAQQFAAKMSEPSNTIHYDQNNGWLVHGDVFKEADRIQNSTAPR